MDEVWQQHLNVSYPQKGISLLWCKRFNSGVSDDWQQFTLSDISGHLLLPAEYETSREKNKLVFLRLCKGVIRQQKFAYTELARDQKAFLPADYETSRKRRLM